MIVESAVPHYTLSLFNEQFILDSIIYTFFFFFFISWLFFHIECMLERKFGRFKFSCSENKRNATKTFLMGFRFYLETIFIL